MLDVVIIGYNDINIGKQLEIFKKIEFLSGSYRHLKTNTAVYFNERITYMDLLNRVLKKATGNDSQLHVAELPNLCAYYLRNFVSKRGLNAKVVNFFNYEKDYLCKLLEDNPRAVAITTTFYVDRNPIIEIIEFIRKYNSKTMIIVGGPYIFHLCHTLDKEKRNSWLKRIGADIYVYDSQGELTLSKVLDALGKKGGAQLNSIPNLIYQDTNGNFLETVREKESNSLDENYPDWNELFGRDSSVSAVQMRSARGCSFNCAFCRYPVLAGPLTLASVETLEKELRSLSRVHAKYISFIDDSFNVPLPRFKEICRMMIRNNFGFKWISYFRASHSDEETYNLMAESGCIGVFLGIESGDQGILNNMNKYADLKSYAEAIYQFKKHGIVVHSGIVVGFPGETEETVKNTINFLEETAPTFWRPELFYYVLDAPIQKRAEEFLLQGHSLHWKHRTMNWRQACDLVDEMCRSVKNSIILPAYDFDFWSIPYLLGKGISLEQFIGFTRIARELLIKGLETDFLDAKEHESRMVSLFSNPE
jgi:p-methyltransferase